MDIILSTTYEVVACCNCGIHFAMPKDFINRRRQDHETFYCPKGHGNYYPQKNETEILKKQLKDVQDCCIRREETVQRLERSNIALRGHLTRKKKAINA